MTRYELLLLLYIAFVILWLGSGFLFHVLGYRADRRLAAGLATQASYTVSGLERVSVRAARALPVPFITKGSRPWPNLVREAV